MGFITSLVIGIIVGASVSIVSIRRERNKLLSSINAAEANLPLEPPDVCPKCGYAGRKAKTGDPLALPPRHAFGKGHHVARMLIIGSPEHLSHGCHSCMFRIKTAAGGHRG